MKGNVYVVSKSHLDLGYTNLAQRVLEKYIEQYIPKAIEVAEELNKDGKKFVWTISSWLLDQALKDDDEKRVKALEEACMRGDIVAHAMPFTMQSELADVTLFEDGLKIVKDLDKRFGRNTVSAKMSDVPGHTIGIVPLLAKYGIKLLHIGVNKSSAIPDVPLCFVWQSGESKVVVVYEGCYGDSVMHPLLDDIVIFDHSMDNCGPYDAKKTLKNFEKIRKKYKDYNVVAGTLDDIAEKLWAIKDNLPVVKEEIGDTWIHGVSSDPYKYGAIKMLEDMRNEWLRKKLISPDSKAYKDFTSNLLCLTEHTAGRGVLNAFRDFDNYLKPDFLEARKLDAKVSRYGIFRLPFLKQYMIKRAGKGRYTRMEKSWAEQRDYVTKAIEALPMKLYREALARIKTLRPESCTFPAGQELRIGDSVKCGKWKIELNGYGAPKNLVYNNKYIIRDNGKSLVDYKSIGPQDYEFWLEHYNRNLTQNFWWAIPDFARPKLKKVAKYYPQGIFPYNFSEAVYDKGKDFERVTVRLAGKKQIMPQLGMPRNLTVQYIFFGDTMQLRLEWTDKDVSRLPEEIWLHFGISPEQQDIIYRKLGTDISPYNVVANGARNLSVTEYIDFAVEGRKYRLVPAQSVPVSLGRGKLLKFDNVFEDSKEGISFLLENNIWGTNYPLWYEDNASMWFNLAPLSEAEKGVKFYEPKLKMNAIPDCLKKNPLDDLEEKPDLSGKKAVEQSVTKGKAKAKSTKVVIEEPLDDEPKVNSKKNDPAVVIKEPEDDDLEIGLDGKIVEPSFDDDEPKPAISMPRQRGFIDLDARSVKAKSDKKAEEKNTLKDTPPKKLSIAPRNNRWITLQSDDTDILEEPKDDDLDLSENKPSDTPKRGSKASAKKKPSSETEKKSDGTKAKDKTLAEGKTANSSAKKSSAKPVKAASSGKTTDVKKQTTSKKTSSSATKTSAETKSSTAKPKTSTKKK